MKIETPKGLGQWLLLLGLLTIPALPKLDLGNDVWITPFFIVIYAVLGLGMLSAIMKGEAKVRFCRHGRALVTVLFLSFVIFVVKWILGRLFGSTESVGKLSRHFLYFHPFLLFFMWIAVFGASDESKTRQWLIALVWITLVATVLYFFTFLKSVVMGGEVQAWDVESYLAGTFNLAIDPKTGQLGFIPRGARSVFALLMLLCSEMALIYHASRKWRYSLAAFFYLCVFLTGSRTALLMLVWVWFLHFAIAAKMNPLQRIASFVTVLVVFFGIGLFAIENQFWIVKIRDMVEFLKGSQSGSSIYQRIECWAAGVEAFSNSPFAILWGITGRFPAAAESIFFFQMYRSGIIGVVLLFAIWGINLSILAWIIRALPAQSPSRAFFRFLKWFTIGWMTMNLLQGQDYLHFQFASLYWGVLAMGYVLALKHSRSHCQTHIETSLPPTAVGDTRSCPNGNA